LERLGVGAGASRTGQPRLRERGMWPSLRGDREDAFWSAACRKPAPAPDGQRPRRRREPRM